MAFPGPKMAAKLCRNDGDHTWMKLTKLGLTKMPHVGEIARTLFSAVHIEVQSVLGHNDVAHGANSAQSCRITTSTHHHIRLYVALQFAAKMDFNVNSGKLDRKLLYFTILLHNNSKIKLLYFTILLHNESKIK